MPRIVQDLREAAWSAVGHSIFSMAKATAYSTILGIFPALMVMTTAVASTTSKVRIVEVIGADLEHFLPTDMIGLVRTYWRASYVRSVHLVWAATLVSLSGAIGVLFSLMEGFRRAYRLPRGVWGLWREPAMALLLIPTVLIPGACAMLFLIAGHDLEQWVMESSGQRFHLYVFFIGRMLRWVTGLLTSIAVLAVVYHYGVPRKTHLVSWEKGDSHCRNAWPRIHTTELPNGIPRMWRTVLPGAVLATGVGFVSTLLYGLYLSRFSEHSLVYGSLSAVIVTLVWLYLVALSVLFGAEFNARLFPPQAISEHTPT